MRQGYIVKVPANGSCAVIPAGAENGVIPAETLAELLETDVTERMRIPAAPAELTGENRVLCYWIDARGGEKDLPVNFCGTCFYHTGCPIHGDLLIAPADSDAEESTIWGFTQEYAEAVAAWLKAQFPEYLL